MTLSRKNGYWFVTTHFSTSQADIARFILAPTFWQLFSFTTNAIEIKDEETRFSYLVSRQNSKIWLIQDTDFIEILQSQNGLRNHKCKAVVYLKMEWGYDADQHDVLAIGFSAPMESMVFKLCYE